MPAAGAAGLAKAALALHHKTLPPTLHCDDPHSLVAEAGLRPISKAEPWEVEMHSHSSAERLRIRRYQCPCNPRRIRAIRRRYGIVHECPENGFPGIRVFCSADHPGSGRTLVTQPNRWLRARQDRDSRPDLGTYCARARKFFPWASVGAAAAESGFQSLGMPTKVARSCSCFPAWKGGSPST